MATTAYGSITIVDIGDLGELTVTPASNQPTMVVYSPDDQSYNPDWSSSPNLVITPVVYYGSEKLIDSSTVTKPNTVTVTWKRKIGSGSETTITTGSPSNHTITSNGSLQITANQLSTSNPLYTYIVEVTYIDANAGITASNALQARGEITYGLIQNATTLKMITVSGANAFLYNSSNVCQNSPITLTAVPTGVTVAKWQYKSGNSWVDIANSASNTLSVSEATSAYFSNDVAVFRALGNDSTTYDEHSIVKLRDGANGTSLNVAVLSNEDQMVPCDKNGNPTSGAFTQCTTTLTIYEGNEPHTDEWTISVDETHGVTGTWDATHYTYTASAISAETGYVIFNCTKGNNTLTKTFSLTKVKAGADGSNGTSPTIYTLEVDALAINKTISNNVTPTTINFSAFTQTGSAARTTYAGKFKVYEDGGTATTYPSTGTASTYAYSVPTSITSTIKVELYDSTGATLYDTQTIVVTNDGQTGATGAGGLTFVLGNYGDQIPCNVSGLVLGGSDITKDITFAAYQGTTKIYCTASVSGTISGKLTSSITQNSKVTLTYVHGTDLGNTTQGNITITLSAYPDSSHTTTSDRLGQQTFTYTWVKNTQGESAVMFQLYTPNGNIVSNNDNAITITPMLLEGAADKTASGTYRWYKYANGTYTTEITSTTSTDPIYKSGNNLIVNPTGIDSYLSIKCEATYTPTGATSSSTYIAYQSVYDKTDIFQISVLSTLGDKLINSIGTGIIYTKVLRNGAPYDEIKSTAVSMSTSSAAFNSAVAQIGVTGADPSNYCWYATNSSLALYKKSGTAWSAVASTSDPHTATYDWTGLHVNDNSSAEIHSWGKKKAILLNGDVVNKKTMFTVEMTTPSN